MQHHIIVKLKDKGQEKTQMTILEYCRNNDIPLGNTPCGGKGTCGKCKVWVTKPYNREVLACQTMICDGMEFMIGKSSPQIDDEMVVLTDNHSADVGNPEINGVDNAGKKETFAACDIGTTTVVCYLVDGASGRIMSTRSAANPQRSFGADVLSRIEAACKKDTAGTDNLEVMRMQIVTLLDGWIFDMLKECGRDEVELLSVAANTVMCHLLMGLSPEKIGRAPFLPDEYFGKEFDAAKTGINNCKTMIIFPAVSGYVGGDITAGMMKTVSPEELTLFLDIGTNGEMALGKGDRYVCCATAAGPAFEGAEIEMGMPAARGAVDKVWLEGRRIKYLIIGNDRPVGICGSGLIDALAVLLQAGIIDENGTILSGAQLPILFRSYVFETEAADRLLAVNTGADGDSYDYEAGSQLAVHIAPGVYITQEDIRKLQLAKGAIAAGIDILFKEYGCNPTDVDVLTFAGGFGNYINKASAAAIGLFPAELVEKVREVGNAAGDGAVEAVLSEEAWDKALDISRKMHYIELASYSGFNDMYIEHMNF